MLTLMDAQPAYPRGEQAVPVGSDPRDHRTNALRRVHDGRGQPAIPVSRLAFRYALSNWAGRERTMGISPEFRAPDGIDSGVGNQTPNHASAAAVERERHDSSHDVPAASRPDDDPRSTGGE